MMAAEFLPIIPLINFMGIWKSGDIGSFAEEVVIAIARQNGIILIHSRSMNQTGDAITPSGKRVEIRYSTNHNGDPGQSRRFVWHITEKRGKKRSKAFAYILVGAISTKLRCFIIPNAVLPERKMLTLVVSSRENMRNGNFRLTDYENAWGFLA